LSCSSEPEANKLSFDKIQGRWLLIEAHRNGNPTETLEGAFFRFDEVQMVTNIFGAEEATSYRLEDHTLIQESSVGSVKYDITSFSDSTLTLEAVMSNFSFKFYCEKGVE